MGLDAIWGRRESLPSYLEENLDLRGVIDDCNWLKSDSSTLLLEGLEVGPRDCSAWGCFYSSHFAAIKVSVVM
ncbi:hypothetical protein B296_00049259 [Ensete ventricosum]|uniref:Uncharacterized protein n=1 Tax=Ensete ventricosum TaxID=4639 RepID=A0A426XAF5_ENSVE|nr:hypothetical protein B296_00049259 [Ensete ventricosum]